MHLKRIVSLANKNSQIQFLAMCRSLRATGCNLPIWVIPYDSNKFDLPDNCIWWEIPEITNWIDSNKMWPAFKKIQCLLIDNYQFVDSDIIFLRNPADILAPHSGFITSCTHWNNPNETVTQETVEFFKKKTTTWPKLVFNSGQWACDTKLYELKELIKFCETHYTETLFYKNYLFKDQAGINLLVNHKDITITNITLPPHNMQSTWAGDYLDEFMFNKLEQWSDKPYIMHWAGTQVNNYYGINQYIFKFLTEAEKTNFPIRKNAPAHKKISLQTKLKMIWKTLFDK
jgi:hypothetical protein